MTIMLHSVELGLVMLCSPQHNINYHTGLDSNCNSSSDFCSCVRDSTEKIVRSPFGSEHNVAFILLIVINNCITNTSHKQTSGLSQLPSCHRFGRICRSINSLPLVLTQSTETNLDANWINTHKCNLTRLDDSLLSFSTSLVFFFHSLCSTKTLPQNYNVHIMYIYISLFV